VNQGKTKTYFGRRIDLLTRYLAYSLQSWCRNNPE